MPARRRRSTDPPPDARPPEDALEQYGSMRDFERTPEPSGAAASDLGDPYAPLTFVVQKHRATRLHSDLRLEVDGVIPSWPVPKCPAPITGGQRPPGITQPTPHAHAHLQGP